MLTFSQMFCHQNYFYWLLKGAITRPATITKTFTQTYPSYMQNFIKIRGAVLEKSGIKIMILCNFNKDLGISHKSPNWVIPFSPQVRIQINLHLTYECCKVLTEGFHLKKERGLSDFSIQSQIERISYL